MSDAADNDTLVMKDQDEAPHHLLVLLLGSLALAGMFLWVSNLTAGGAYGGRYDVPVVNYMTWFAFLMAAAVVIMLAVVCLLRVVEWLWLRRRNR